MFIHCNLNFPIYTFESRLLLFNCYHIYIFDKFIPQVPFQLNPLWPAAANKMNQRTDDLEKLGVLLVITGHGEILFGILLDHSGLLADVDAVQELPDVLLSDRGGLLDQSRWKETEEPSVKGETWSHATGRWFNVNRILPQHAK